MTGERELEHVLRWFERTDAIAMEHFGADVPTERKSDGTPVTVADRAIEDALRAALAESFPDDGILGEERGGGSGAARRWIIDPIDATKNFARGIPIFGTLVALEDAEGLLIGAASAPALGNRWWAVRGGGAFRDGAPIRVSGVAHTADAQVSMGSISYADGAQVDGWIALARSVARTRGFGDFWGHMLVAQGSIEAMVEFAPLSLWDIAAPKIIVEEAGGRGTGLDGDAALREGPFVATNGALHDAVLAALHPEEG